MKKIIFILFFLFFSIFTTFFSYFVWWNNQPQLKKRSTPPIIKLKMNDIKTIEANNIKIASYNIHFGIGFDAKTKAIDKKSYLERLTNLSSVIKKMNADVVLLQEVDFKSKRSFFIDEAEYIAKMAGYKYIAKAPTLKKKFHMCYNFVFGKLNYGISIISKYPIVSNEMVIFDYSKEIPNFIKWLFDPHGAQKCLIEYKGRKIEIVNLHLDPWSQELRENQIEHLKEIWLDRLKVNSIVGGDFNALAYYENKKDGFFQQDAPWFINRKKWDLKNDKTLLKLINLGFKEALESISIKFIVKTANYFTYPANHPLEKIDHIFTKNKLKVIHGSVFDDAKTASDHLPIYAEIQLN
jgi:endonuclease/exonuclease/phosphatase family metal-dependent hydrolase